MFEPNVLENRPIDPHAFDLNQEAIAPTSLLGLDTASTQPTQLLGSEYVSKQIQNPLETQFLKGEEILNQSPEAEMVNNSFKGLFRSVSSNLRHHHSNFQDKLNSLIEDYSSNSQDIDELTGVSANFSTQSVGPDVKITSLTTPNTVYAGDFIRLDYTITNEGNADVDSSWGWSQTKFYLSTDTTLDAADTYLTNDYNYDWNLSAGESNADYVYLSLNQNLEAGNYYLLAQADANNEINESNEYNNITYQQITVGGTPEPDLIISNLSGDNTIEAGNYLWLDYTVTNQGNGSSDWSQTHFYLSTDTTLDGTDTYLDSSYSWSLSSGGSKEGFAFLDIDRDLAGGDYYILAQADANNEVSESNENNNLAYHQLTVTQARLADLTVSNIAVGDSIMAGSYIDISYTINNLGNLDIDLYNVNVINVTPYLSTDAILDSSDFKFTTDFTLGPLQADGSMTVSHEVYLDVMESGTYYLFLKADDINFMEEWNEENNTAYITLDINPSVDGYSIYSGYGLVDAAAAVAEAVNQPTFADVPDLGGNYWGADLVNAPEVWNAGYTGDGVVVAVLDTGVDHNHEDLKDNIWTNWGEIAGDGIDNDGNGYIDDVYGWDFTSDSNHTLDIQGHGTHVAGTIAAANNGIGVTGIAYNAEIMPVQVLNDSGSGSLDGIVEGIRYAVDNGADVINMSLGSGIWGAALYRSLLEAEYGAALQYASDNNVVVVMSAGNDGASGVFNYPGALAHTWGLAVGAVDENNKMADFSNRSGEDKLAYVTAPGVEVLSTTPNNNYESDGYSGTSMAAPHVAGVVALMLEANPHLTEAQVRQIVTGTAENTQYS
ncbi:MAG: S8 family serine peptidase [Crocosphaera sp.]